MNVVYGLENKTITYSLVECSIFNLFNLQANATGKFVRSYFNKTFTTTANNIFNIRQELNNKINLKSCKSLVVYFTNLGSTLGIKRYPNDIKNLIFLTPTAYSIIVGLILSDGYLEKSNLSARLVFKQSLVKCKYVLNVFMTLHHYSKSIPAFYKGIRNETITYAVGFKTRSLPCFNEIYDLFYKDKIKQIPDNIYDLLTPIAIAHWIMGDGAKLNKGLILCTDSYTVQEVLKLMNVLKIKYDINSTLQGIKNNRPRIYILQKSMPKLINIVKPYMLKSMLYKLHL